MNKHTEQICSSPFERINISRRNNYSGVSYICVGLMPINELNKKNNCLFKGWANSTSHR